MNKSLFSAVVVSALMVCSTLSAAVTTASPSAAAGANRVVTLPTITIVGKRDSAAETVTLPTVYIVAHRDTSVQVASR